MSNVFHTFVKNIASLYQQAGQSEPLKETWSILLVFEKPIFFLTLSSFFCFYASPACISNLIYTPEKRSFR
jgi:hypothetical protein